MCNVEFEFSNNVERPCERPRVMENLWKDANCSCCPQKSNNTECERTEEFQDSVRPNLHQGNNIMSIEESDDPNFLGDWIDLNGLNFSDDDIANSEPDDENENIELCSYFSMNESEKNIFEEEIRSTFPYYRNN